MQSKGYRILAGIGAVLAFAVVIVWSLISRQIPDFNAKPIPTNAQSLNEADIEKLLGVEQFRVVRKVRQVPSVVKDSFSNFTRIPFDLVDPGERMKDYDMTSPGKSSRRLVFLGLSEDSAILVYEQGGFATVCNVVVFWYGDGGRGWVANIGCYPFPKNIPTLKSAFQKGNFQPWERRD
jgi:hypothetical protein